jgi:hypothetical protein
VIERCILHAMVQWTLLVLEAEDGELNSERNITRCGLQIDSNSRHRQQQISDRRSSQRNDTEFDIYQILTRSN